MIIIRDTNQTTFEVEGVIVLVVKIYKTKAKKSSETSLDSVSHSLLSSGQGSIEPGNTDVKDDVLLLTVKFEVNFDVEKDSKHAIQHVELLHPGYQSKS